MESFIEKQRLVEEDIIDSDDSEEAWISSDDAAFVPLIGKGLDDYMSSSDESDDVQTVKREKQAPNVLSDCIVNARICVKDDLIYKVKLTVTNNHEAAKKLSQKELLHRLVDGKLKMKRGRPMKHVKYDYILEYKDQTKAELNENMLKTGFLTPVQKSATREKTPKKKKKKVKREKKPLDDELLASVAVPLSAGPTITCCFCGSILTSVQLALTHYTQRHHHTAAVCVICRKSFPTDLLSAQHMLVGHHRGWHECPFGGCGQRYMQRLSLRRHLVKRHLAEYKHVTGCPPGLPGADNVITDSARSTDTSVTADMTASNNDPAADNLVTNFISGQVKCDMCDDVFSDIVYMEEHRKRVHANGSVMNCRICKRTFASAKYMRRHVRSMHGLYVTSEDFGKDGRPPSEETSESGSFPCPMCHLKFANKAELEDHATKEHLTKSQTCDLPDDFYREIDMFVCPLCELPFWLWRGLQRHLQRAHLPTDRDAVQYLLTELKEQPEQFVRKWMIQSSTATHWKEKAKERVEGLDLVTVHIKEYLAGRLAPNNGDEEQQEGKVGADEEKEAEPDGLQQHDAGRNAIPGRAAQSEHEAELSATTDTPSRTKSADLLLDCAEEGCTERFPDLILRLEHEYHEHGRRFICPEPDCMDTFVTYSALLTHVQGHSQSAHTRARLQCPHCRAFLSDGAFPAHARRCRAKNDPAKRRRLECAHEGCGLTFTNQAGLTNHAKTHRPRPALKPKLQHPCALCDRVFQSKQDMRRHARVHSGERPFVCEHCGRGFKQNAHMRDHVRRVHGAKTEGPYVCAGCGHVFPRKCLYSLHINKGCAALRALQEPGQVLADLDNFTVEAVRDDDVSMDDIMVTPNDTQS